MHSGKIYLMKGVSGLENVKGKVYQVYIVGQGDATVAENMEALGNQLQEITDEQSTGVIVDWMVMGTAK